MTWLLPVIILQFNGGLYTAGVIQAYELPRPVQILGSFYTGFEMKIRLLNSIEIGGALIADEWLYQDEAISGWPTQLVSELHAEVTVGAATVGYRHTCYHPVIPLPVDIGRVDYIITPKIDGGYEEWYCKIRLEWRP